MNLKDYEDELRERIEQNNVSWEMWCDHYNNTVVVEITWGDWKHDHLFCDYLVESFLKEKGFTQIDRAENVTDSDGSDCYSAIHYYTIRR